MDRNEFVKTYVEMQRDPKIAEPAPWILDCALMYACMHKKRGHIKDLVVEIRFSHMSKSVPTTNDDNVIDFDTDVVFTDELARDIIALAVARGFCADLDTDRRVVCVRTTRVTQIVVRPGVCLVERDEKRKKVVLVVRDRHLELSPDNARFVDRDQRFELTRDEARLMTDAIAKPFE